MKLPKYIYVRIIAVIILAVLCFALSYNKIFTKSTSQAKPNVDSLLAVLDKKIDTTLFSFTIQDYWIKKIEVEIPNMKWKRVTRDVSIPKDTMKWKTKIFPTLINEQLHELARSYNCEPFATQDLKKLTLSMQMKCEGIIVEQIQLTTTNNLPSPPKPKMEIVKKQMRNKDLRKVKRGK